ncbi:biogenesis of lysosome-related organelles complex 1 subunit 1-like [Antedon mediterranea]|uniref:biogenesis of lysosome-related organelles complex 1 subunit 1-like n=1 Tax=Antedon mediterranea TaxID=105859 RepID=UPI003AF91D8C
MLSVMLKEHQVKLAMRKDEQEIRRKEAVASAMLVSEVLTERLNRGVSEAYANEKKLDTEAKKLQNSASQFSRQTIQWLQIIDNFNQALKEIGDVENWATSIETDMRTIASALEYAYKEAGE